MCPGAPGPIKTLCNEILPQSADGHEAGPSISENSVFTKRPGSRAERNIWHLSLGPPSSEAGLGLAGISTTILRCLIRTAIGGSPRSCERCFLLHRRPSVLSRKFADKA